MRSSLSKGVQVEAILAGFPKKILMKIYCLYQLMNERKASTMTHQLGEAGGH
jgi:hypothetical protein